MLDTIQLGFRHSFLQQIVELGATEVRRILCGLRGVAFHDINLAISNIAADPINNDAYFEHLDCYGPMWIAHILGPRISPLRSALPRITAHFNFHCGTNYSSHFMVNMLRYLHTLKIYQEYSRSEIIEESKRKNKSTVAAIVAPQPLVLQAEDCGDMLVSINIPDDATDETHEELPPPPRKRKSSGPRPPRKRNADDDDYAGRSILSYDDAAKQIAAEYTPSLATAYAPVVSNVVARPMPNQTATHLTRVMAQGRNAPIEYPNMLQRIAAGQTTRITSNYVFAAFASSCFTVGNYVAVPRIAQAVVGFAGVNRLFIPGNPIYGTMRPGPYALVPANRVRCYGPFVSAESIADCTMMLVPE